MVSPSFLLAAIAGLGRGVVAVNVLFVNTLQGIEYQEATVTLGYNGETACNLQEQEAGSTNYY